MDEDTLKARLAEWAEQQICGCGKNSPRVEWRLEAKPIGTFSLAGQQMKVTATEWPWLVCDGCGRESRGKLA
jgi:hypothetical protein